MRELLSGAYLSAYVNPQQQHFVVHGSVIDIQSQDICFFLRVLYITFDIFHEVWSKVFVVLC